MTERLMDVFFGLGFVVTCGVGMITVPFLIYKLAEMFPAFLRHILEYKQASIKLRIYEQKELNLLRLPPPEPKKESKEEPLPSEELP